MFMKRNQRGNTELGGLGVIIFVGVAFYAAYDIASPFINSEPDSDEPLLYRIYPALKSPTDSLGEMARGVSEVAEEKRREEERAEARAEAEEQERINEAMREQRSANQ